MFYKYIMLLKISTTVLALLLLFSCTLPGFLHVIGVRKQKDIHIVCVGLGLLFGINLLLLVVEMISCSCEGECKCGKDKDGNCNC